jgi:hypothetical protein
MNFEKTFFEEMHLTSVERKQNLKKMNTLNQQAALPYKV